MEIASIGWEMKECLGICSDTATNLYIRSYLHDRHSRMVPQLRASASSTMYVQEEGRHEDPKAETQQTAKAGKK